MKNRLPLSRLYAGYFGGSLDLVSMYGWGTDCYVVLRTVESSPIGIGGRSSSTA